MSSSSSSDPSLLKNPRRSSAAIYMYVTEGMIKIFFFQASLHVNPHRVLLNFYLFLQSALLFSGCMTDFYTCRALTYVQTVL